MSTIHHLGISAQLQEQIRQTVQAGVAAAVGRMSDDRLLSLMKEGLKKPEVAMLKAA